MTIISKIASDYSKQMEDVLIQKIPYDLQKYKKMTRIALLVISICKFGVPLGANALKVNWKNGISPILICIEYLLPIVSKSRHFINLIQIINISTRFKFFDIYNPPAEKQLVSFDYMHKALLVKHLTEAAKRYTQFIPQIFKAKYNNENSCIYCSTQLTRNDLCWLMTKNNDICCYPCGSQCKDKEGKRSLFQGRNQDESKF